MQIRFLANFFRRGRDNADAAPVNPQPTTDDVLALADRLAALHDFLLGKTASPTGDDAVVSVLDSAQESAPASGPAEQSAA